MVAGDTSLPITSCTAWHNSCRGVQNDPKNEKLITMAKTSAVSPQWLLFWSDIASKAKLLVDVMYSAKGHIEISSDFSKFKIHPNTLPNNPPS